MGDQLALQWAIHFPWVMDAQRFGGETIYSIRPLISGESMEYTVRVSVEPGLPRLNVEIFDS